MAAHPPDFALLYARLGLPPDCTLEQFKRACRRRIAQLHPDKTRPGAAPPTPELPVSELISLYVSAVRFHRRHGRLPGGRPLATAPAATPPSQAHPAAHMSGEAASASGPGDAVPPLSWRTWLLTALGVALLLALFAALDREPVPAIPADPAPAEAAQDRGLAIGRTAAAPPLLELGMDQATVRAIQGEPLQHDDRDWIYGPSWIRFERGRVVDWYSSPLYRLHTATPAPPRDAVEAADPP